MKFNTDNITWTEAMKEYATDRAERKLGRLLDDLGQLEFKLSKVEFKIKVSVTIGGYRAQEVNEDFYTATDKALIKLKQIIVKKAKKLTGKAKKRMEQVEQPIEEESIIREKLFILDPETVESAINKFEKTDYSFYIFKDIDDNDKIAVIYRRLDNKYGIIRYK